jgi:ABC-type sugar transport system ATPase subunit
MLEIKALKKCYTTGDGQVVALDGVSLAISANEFAVILGPSGSGKSTLLHVVAGLLPADGGEVIIRDNVATHAPVSERRVAMVLQNLGLYPHKTVMQNVEYPMLVAKAKGDERKRCALDLLRLLKISDLADRKPRTLSGGQLQRVALARALAKKADLFLLDEPFSDLDAQIRYELRNELKLLHVSRGLTTVLVTHDQEDAMALADRIALMHKGKIIEVGSPRRLYEQPRTVFAATFMGRPPMTVFRVSLAGRCPYFDGSRLPIDIADTTIPSIEGDVLLGLRPEDISVVMRAGEWCVELIQAAGGFCYVHLKWARLRMVCRSDSQTELRIGDRVALKVMANAHFFDPQTEERIK